MIAEQTRRKTLVKDFSQYLLSSKRKNRIDNAVEQLNIQNRFGNLVNKICKNTTVMRLEQEHVKFADFRTRKKIAPACNKGEYKDCYIWGTYMAVLKKLHSTNVSYFITTNPRDYMQGSTTTAQIMADCSVVNGNIIFHIGKLYSELKNLINP